MIKYISIFLILLGAFGTFPAQKRTNLDEDWRFHFGHSEDAKADFNYRLVNIFSKSMLFIALFTSVSKNLFKAS
jgi:beta-galactosidase